MDSEREEMLQKIGKLFGASPISDSFMETVSENDSDPHRIQLCNMLRVTTVAEVEVLEKIKMHVREMGIALDPRNLKKYLVSRLRMDGHEASFCRTSWVFTFGRTKGGPEGPSEVLQFTCHHEYIDVMVKDGDDPTRLIGDMNFRSQFELARSTETYKELTKFIPRVFVGLKKAQKDNISALQSCGKIIDGERPRHSSLEKNQLHAVQVAFQSLQERVSLHRHGFGPYGYG